MKCRIPIRHFLCLRCSGAKPDCWRRHSKAEDARRVTSIIQAELSLSIQLHAKLSAIFQYLI
jgi:hypothetical protein